MGKKENQFKFINISYRYRGSVHRTHTQTNTKVQEVNKQLSLRALGEMNIQLNKVDMKKMLAYSAIKIIANPTEPYSILKPDTNSDSPSAKSKGVRFVSATQLISQITTKGVKIRNLNVKEFNLKKLIILNLWAGIRKKRRTNAKEIS